MQKKLIALAIAGLSSAAFAQSNVTIYGAADVTYDNVKAGGDSTAGNNYARRGRTTMNSSYIGFKGTEAIGNGMSAVFQVETGFHENMGTTNTNAVSATTGLPVGASGGLGNRDTFVGLSSNWGTVVAGTLTGPARALGAKMDVNVGATGIGNNGALLGKTFGGSGAGYVDQRFANAIAYVSPTMGGFNGVLAYVPNENRSKDLTTPNAGATDTSAWTLGLNYDNGPLMVGYAFTNVKDKTANGTLAATGLPSIMTGVGAVDLAKLVNNRLAVKYGFQGFTVGLLWDQTKADWISATPAQVQAKTTVWYLPVTYTFGASKAIFQYGKAKNPTGSGVTTGNDYAATHTTLGYEYSLSKRTTLKAVYSQITNKANATYDYLYGVSAPNSTAPGAGVVAGTDPRGFSFGMRHSF